MDAPDPVQALMANLGEPSAEVARLLGNDRGQPVAPTSAEPAVDGHFLEYEEQCFGDVIEEVIAELKAEGT